MASFNTNKIINFAGFQLIWIVAVVGAAKSIVWPCYLLTALFAIWQLLPKNRHTNDLKLLAVALPIGFITDSAWQLLGLVDYASSYLFDPFAPLWIMCLWLSFALTFNHSLGWLKNKHWLIIIFGVIGSPLSYFAGSRLGAMQYLSDPKIVSLIFAISWAMILSLLFSIASKDLQPLSSYKQNVS